MLEIEEIFLDFQLQEGKRVKDNCHTEFACVIPILNKAVTGLQKLNMCDISELKSMKHPPLAIVNLLTAVCIILKV
jgi:hypothetical protein